MKRLINTLLTIFLVLPSTINFVSAHDYTREKAELFNFFISNGVIEEVADSLVEKYFNGEILDSMNEEMYEYGIVEVIDSLDLSVRKVTYPDGSISISIVEQPHSNNSTINAFSVSGGSYSSGSNWWSYTKARVHESNGVVTATFYIDYSGNSYEQSKITRIYTGAADWKIVVIGGSFSNPVFVMIRSQATSTHSAQATMTFNVTLIGMISTNYKVSAHVQGVRAFSSTT